MSTAPLPSSKTSVALLSLAVGIVLADSAIVTLALPSIMRELDAGVSEVSWVLTGFNLVLAVAAVPAAMICARGASRWTGVVGLVAFAAASAGCALAGSMELLIISRVAQAIGGALVIASTLELLAVATGDERRGAARWAAAGVAGSAIGPVVGGLMTEAISWQSIFIIQVPLVLLAVPIALRVHPVRSERRAGGSDRPDSAALLTLALISAALTAALFLLVLMLVEGWQRSPATAAIAVTAIPLAAVSAGALGRALRAGTRAEAIAGSILVAGGLACLGLLPDANPLWTVPAQILVGLGLGLTVDSLTQLALKDREPLAIHGGWTIAARHGGIVVGLLILTPVFTADLTDARRPAQEAIVAQVLDADLPGTTKLQLAESLDALLVADDGRVPDVSAAFDSPELPSDESAQLDQLERDLNDQLERAATRAFRTAFLIAAALALAALLPALFLREAGAAAAIGGRGFAFIGVAALASAALLGIQLASGGTSFTPQRTADPCGDRARPAVDDFEGLAEAVILVGLDETACELGVSRERLLLALPDEETRAQLARDAGTDPAGLAEALQDGLSSGIDRLERDGELPSVKELMPSLVAELGLSPSLANLIPSSLTDELPPTAELLRLAVDDLDVNAIFDGLDSGEPLDGVLREQLIKSALDQVRGRIADSLPGPFGGLIG